MGSQEEEIHGENMDACKSQLNALHTRDFLLMWQGRHWPKRLTQSRGYQIRRTVALLSYQLLTEQILFLDKPRYLTE